MEPDLGLIIGFISVVGGIAVLGLSYLGAYFIGYNRARNEIERQRREEEAVAQAMERLTNAQRVMLLEQARGANSADRRPDAVRLKQHNTPA